MKLIFSSLGQMNLTIKIVRSEMSFLYKYSFSQNREVSYIIGKRIPPMSAISVVVNQGIMCSQKLSPKAWRFFRHGQRRTSDKIQNSYG